MSSSSWNPSPSPPPPPPQHEGDEDDNVKIGIAKPTFKDDDDEDDDDDEEYRQEVEMLKLELSESALENSISSLSSHITTPTIMPPLKLPPPPPPTTTTAAVSSPQTDDNDEKILYREQLDRAQEVVAAADHDNNNNSVRKERLFRNHESLSMSSMVSASHSSRLPRATRPGAVAVAGPPEYHIPMRQHRVEYVLPHDAAHVPIVLATSVQQVYPTAPESSRHASGSSHSRLGPRNKEERRLWYLGGIVAFCVLAATAVFVGFRVHQHNSNQSSNNGSSSSSTGKTPTTIINGMTQFDAYTTDCNALSKQSNPHVLTQCLCTGTISYVASDIQDHYDFLFPKLIPSLFPEQGNQTQTSIQSCHVHNQALVWLASGDGRSPLGTPKAKLQQRYALAILFMLWNGPTWHLTAASWISADDECTWFGISCLGMVGIEIGGQPVISNSRFNTVSGMVLNHLNLQGLAIPTELGLLTTLEKILLLSVGLVGTIPKELFNVKSLLSLDLTDNKLSGTIPSQIGQLDHLEIMRFSNNKITGFIPPEICNCTRLQVVNVDGNLLNGTAPKCLASL